MTRKQYASRDLEVDAETLQRRGHPRHSPCGPRRLRGKTIASFTATPPTWTPPASSFAAPPVSAPTLLVRARHGFSLLRSPRRWPMTIEQRVAKLERQ